MKKQLLTLTLTAFVTIGMASCGGGQTTAATTGDQPTQATTQQGGKKTVTLWGWGDTEEINVFSNLLKAYNDTNQEGIYVNFVKKPSGSYYSSLETNLTGRQAPDLFYVGDSMIKRYANAGYLEDLTPYVEANNYDTDDIWPTLMNRYQFNEKTYQHSDEDPIWGLPKDMGSTAIFYNQDALEAQGIKVISAKDADGDGKVTVDGVEYDARGYDPNAKVFNNKIAMTFEELEEISNILNHNSAIKSKHQTRWTFYSSWWFFAGFSVGGDTIQFVETEDPTYNGGYWQFSLDNNLPNYRVLKDVTLNGHDYKAESFVDYWDLPFMDAMPKATKDQLIAEGTIVQLPSIRETFEWWISLFHRGISPKPEDINTELGLFTNEEVAMFVTGRYNTIEFRKNAKFNWDCAPLPKHKDGAPGGHSGGMCLSMSKRCENKDLAFKVVEYLTGKIGQDALAETGFNVPAQISLALDPNGNYQKSTLAPKNNEVFVDASYYQPGGDWTYLKDDVWIEMWAPKLNGDVLNGVYTVQQLFNEYNPKVNDFLKTYTLAN